MSSWLLYLNTLRYLRPIQVVGRAIRRQPRVRAVLETPRRRPVGARWQAAIQKRNPEVGPVRYRFLNLERETRGWNDEDLPKLWLYNLHYFEYVRAARVEEWIAGNPVGAGNGWEPYPLSLRMANWVKWSLGGGELSETAAVSLVLQARYLSGSVEYHLLANHLFANAKALVFAGAFFQGAEADGWLRRGLRILERELTEQVLRDGGHFERSPMYHSLILEDVLDLTNLAGAYPDVFSADVRRAWCEAATRMLGWLRGITHPDGRISFFNDAAFGVAAEPAELAGYAARLGIESVAGALGESGYIRLANERAVVIFDAAAIGPDYQPGHAHSDTLSFELSVDGRRELVNSGISTYENNAARRAERETAAHNTVRVDGVEQSEVWSAFRVARRARPCDVETDGRTYAEASHDGYRRLPDALTHTRRVELGAAELVITDTLAGSGEHSAEVFFHLHPDALVDVELDARLSRRDDCTEWHPEFHRGVANRTVVGAWKGRCPVQFTTRIRFGEPSGGAAN